MGGHSGPSSVAFTYDAQGRVTRIRRRMFNNEYTTDISYNEHGDKAVEIERRAQIGDQSGQAQRPGLPSYSEVRYSYKYDDRGNWTGGNGVLPFQPRRGFHVSNCWAPTATDLLLSWIAAQMRSGILRTLIVLCADFAEYLQCPSHKLAD